MIRAAGAAAGTRRVSVLSLVLSLALSLAFTLAIGSAVVLALACAAPAWAQAPDLRASVAEFGKDSYAATNKAVADLGAGAEPRAALILQALKEERLLVDPATKAVYLADAAGHVTDAVAGAAVDPAPADLKPVRQNNRVRSTLAAALGTVLLAAPDPAKRAEAARTIFRTRDAGALLALTAAQARETDTGARKAMSDADAALFALV